MVSVRPWESDNSSTSNIDTSASAVDSNSVRRRDCTRLRRAMPKYLLIPSPA